MSLLREIQDAAIDSDAPITDLLRRCKILAARLGNEELARWADQELEGYESQEDLPNYRILSVSSYGHFSGPFGSGLKNALIPPISVPEDFREIVETAYIFDPIGSLAEGLAGEGTDTTLRSEWPANMVVLVGSNIYRNMTCLSAWRLIPRGSLMGILDTVRNRVLSFALAIEAELPGGSEEALEESTISEEKVSQVFQTHIYGDVGSLAQASSRFAQIGEVRIGHNDFESLKAFLTKYRVEDVDIEDLKEALDADANDGVADRIGPQSSSWIGNMVEKASSGAWGVATSVAAHVLTDAISQYLGL